MREKELRLALVCYGGISLAVYMHGITKEVWRLLRASRGHAHDEGAVHPAERVYRDLLAEMEAASGMRLRVIADIVAGASAGGINGIFLAQAIATGQSLEPLTDLWLTSADVEALIDPAAAPPGRFSKLWALPIAWMAAGRSAASVDALADPATRTEVRAKLSHFVRSRWFEPPFGGATFTNLLLDALEAMARSEKGRGEGRRLLPDDQPLDLFVTVTDFTGHPERLTLHSPPEVIETEHRLVIGFSQRGGARDLASIPELAFAARATSSFPGAFPPFSVGELDGALAARHSRWPGRRRFLARVLPRHSAIGQTDKAVLIDGSVLANAPFGPAIAVLGSRPARRQVDRRFVYIDPKPGLRGQADKGDRDEPPGFFQTILGSVSELPRQQPIRDNLEAIAARSARIERMLGVVDALRPNVDAQIEALFGRALLFGRPTPERLVGWRRKAQATAAARAGYSHAAYGHLKIANVVDQLVERLSHAGSGDTAGQRAAIRAAVAATVRERGWDAPDRPEGIDFLRRFDTGFRLRRLRLLARRLAEIEETTPQVETAPMREAIYASIAAYLARLRDASTPTLRKGGRHVARDAAPAIDALDEALDLTGLDHDTDVRLATALATLGKTPRRALLLAYLGFAYLDVATLPLLQGEGQDEFDPIKVDRISPDDARSIRAGGAEATLKGIQFNSFGAFFSRAYRENDYLWGRLHGAERMIDIVASTLPAGVRLKPGRLAAIKRAAFRAILAEEAPRLTAVPGLIAELSGEIG